LFYTTKNSFEIPLAKNKIKFGSPLKNFFNWLFCSTHRFKPFCFLTRLFCSTDLKNANSLHLRGKIKIKKFPRGNLKGIFCRDKAKSAYFTGIKTYFINLMQKVIFIILVNLSYFIFKNGDN
jgi:hypothetical protein